MLEREKKGELGTKKKRKLKDLEASGNAVEKCRPITCLPLMWKLLTGMIAEEMYTYSHRENLLPEEKKDAGVRVVALRINC